MKNLFIVLATLLVVYATTFIRPLRKLYAGWLQVRDTVLIPHQAPDSALLGRYERVKGPFMVPLDSTTDMIVEDHEWSIDMSGKKYNTVARGYLHVKQADGSYKDYYSELHQDNNYDTLRTHKTASYQLPVVAVKEVPDTVHQVKEPSSYQDSFWKKFRSVKLPHTIRTGEVVLTIRKRTIDTFTKNDSVFVRTTLTCTVKDLTSKEPASPITMEETHPLE